MSNNPVLEALFNRKSIRKYTGEMPADEIITTIVKAGQQAPFALQLCSLLLSRDRDHNRFRAPLLFTICVDSHRLEAIMERRGWLIAMNDLSLLILGIQDAALVAENMVIAAESLGLGSCFLGNAPYLAEKIVESYRLPKRVFPLVQLTMGYPAENPPPRPRYPLEFTLFEDQYPALSDALIDRAIASMDEYYLAHDHYRQKKRWIPLEGERAETYSYDNYSWSEHISRKAGQWLPSPKELLQQMKKCGFRISTENDN